MNDIMIEHYPTDWQLYRLGQLLRERKEKGSDKEYPPLSVTKKGILPQLETVAKSDDSENRKIVRKGDFVINSRSDRKGSGGISNYDGSVSLINIVLEPLRIHPRLCHHLLRSTAFQEEFYRWGHGIVADLWTTRFTEMQNIKICLPKKETQHLIANFLDKKTTKIDLLINKIERKIELLKEQQISLISQCVTRGLNPTVKMKNSGIEWIGKIPKHWKLKKLKYIVLYNTKTISGETNPEYLFHYVEIGDVDYVDGITINEKISFHESPSRARRVVTYYDVIISTVRTYLRAIGVIPNIKDVICSTGFCVLTGNPKEVKQDFLLYSLKSEQFISKMISNSYGVSYPAINASELVGIKIALPPLDEQIRISEYLTKNNEQANRLVDALKKKKMLLNEYRQSLISNAVTGKMRITEDMI